MASPPDLHEPNDELVAALGLLERRHAHAVVADPRKGEGLAQASPVLGTLEGDERLVESPRLPIGLVATEIASVSDEAIADVVMPPVLPALHGVAATTLGDARAVHQCQTQRAGVRLVRAVLGVGEQGHAVCAAAVGEVDELMRRHLELPIVHVAALDRADVPVVRGAVVRRREWEGRLERGGIASPVDGVADLDAVAGLASREPNRLHEPGGVARSLDPESDTYRPAFDDAHGRRPADVGTWRRRRVVPVHVPGGPLRR